MAIICRIYRFNFLHIFLILLIGFFSDAVCRGERKVSDGIFIIPAVFNGHDSMLLTDIPFRENRKMEFYFNSKDIESNKTYYKFIDIDSILLSYNYYFVSVKSNLAVKPFKIRASTSYNDEYDFFVEELTFKINAKSSLNDGYIIISDKILTVTNDTILTLIKADFDSADIAYNKYEKYKYSNDTMFYYNESLLLIDPNTAYPIYGKSFILDSCKYILLNFSDTNCSTELRLIKCQKGKLIDFHKHEASCDP